MISNDHRKIRVGEHEIGIIGLVSAFERIEATAVNMDEDEIKAELIKVLKTRNYIPHSTEELYGDSFLREYKKWKGEVVEEVGSGDLQILILGPGCSQCNDLEKAVVQELSNMNIAAAVEHITDIKEIARYGMVRTPALIINGKIVSAGTVPNSRRLREIISRLTKY